MVITFNVIIWFLMNILKKKYRCFFWDMVKKKKHCERVERNGGPRLLHSTVHRPQHDVTCIIETSYFLSKLIITLQIGWVDSFVITWLNGGTSWSSSSSPGISSGPRWSKEILITLWHWTVKLGAFESRVLTLCPDMLLIASSFISAAGKWCRGLTLHVHFFSIAVRGGFWTARTSLLFVTVSRKAGRQARVANYDDAAVPPSCHWYSQWWRQPWSPSQGNSPFPRLLLRWKKWD